VKTHSTTLSCALLTLWALCCAGCTHRIALPKPAQPLVPTKPVAALTHAPASAVPEQPSLPKVRAFRLANGLMLYALESHAFGHVSAAFVNLRGGENLNDLEQAGLPSLITQTLLASADTRDGPPSTPSTPLSQSGPESPILIRFGGITRRHTAVIGTTVESRFLEQALSSMAQLVRTPTLDERTLARARKRARADWDEERGGVRGIALNHINQRLYGPGHVLGQHADMAIKRLDAHDLAQVIAGHRTRYVPAASAVVLVGDFDPVAASELINQHFGGWKSDFEAPRTYAKPDWQPRGKRKIFLHTRIRVAHIALGQHAPGPSDPDYVATEVLTQLLGGSFSSRLMTRLRGETGLAYSVGTLLYPRRDGSLLTIETEVARDDAEEALTLVGAEVRKLRDGQVTEEELGRVVSTLRQQAIARYERPSSGLAALCEDLELGMDPVLRPATYLKQLEELTTAQLSATAKRVLKPQAPVVIVGDMRQVGDLGRWAASDDEDL